MQPNSLNSTFSSNCLHPLELNSYPSSKISNQGCWGRGSLFIFLFLIPLQHFASSFCERGQTFYFHLLLARKWHSWVAPWGPGESMLSVFPDFQQREFCGIFWMYWSLLNAFSPGFWGILIFMRRPWAFIKLINFKLQSHPAKNQEIEV